MKAIWIAVARALAVPTVQELTIDKDLRATQALPSFSRFVADVQSIGVIMARIHPHDPTIKVEASERDWFTSSTMRRAEGLEVGP